MNADILLIEDSDDDVLMVSRAFKKNNSTCTLHRVENGQKAISFLESTDSDTISLILLDLNMEIMNGFEFLEKRKDIQKIRRIPAVVLTSSSRSSDINKAYDLGANSYVEKPVEPAELISKIKKIEDFWIHTSEISKTEK